MCASKKGVSSLQFNAVGSESYRSALFMTHRLRAAMDPIYAAAPVPMGGASKLWKWRIHRHQKGAKRKAVRSITKNTVFVWLRRVRARSAHSLDYASKEIVKAIVAANVRQTTRHYTDGCRLVSEHAMELEAATIGLTNWPRGYVRGECTRTNRGLFLKFFKRMKGVPALLREAFAPVIWLILISATTTGFAVRRG